MANEKKKVHRALRHTLNCFNLLPKYDIEQRCLTLEDM